MIRSFKYFVLIIHLVWGCHLWGQVSGGGEPLTEPLLISRINEQIKFENYSSRDGLSQNSCFAIAQDGNGFMWFGTQDGLNRFDGNKFYAYVAGQGSRGNQVSNHIWSLEYMEEADELWIGTYDGLCIYLPETDSIYLVGEIYSFASILNSVPIKGIYTGQPGHIWIVTTNNGLIHLDTERQKLEKYFSAEDQANQVMDLVILDDRIIVGLSNQLYSAGLNDRNQDFKPLGAPIFSIIINSLVAHDRTLWIGTLSSGIYRMDMSTGSVHPILDDQNIGGVDCFWVEGGEYLWIGTRGNGVIRYHLGTGTCQVARYNRYESNSLGADFVLDLFLDNQNIMWCGLSGGGISKYDPLKFQFYNLINDPMGPVSLPENMIYSIYKNAGGHYYAGSQNKGLFEWNPEGGGISHFMVSSLEGAPENKIFDIEDAGADKLWVASWGGLFQFDPVSGKFANYSDENFPQSNRLLEIHKFRQNGKLLLSGDNGAAIFDPLAAQWSVAELAFLKDFHFIARYIYEDDEGVLWICSERRSLVRLDLAEKQVETIPAVRHISKTVRHMYMDDDLLWIATDNGIVVYNALQKEVIRHITLEDLGPSNVVYAIQKDANGYFWAGTNIGILRINQNDYSMQLYNLENGLEFLEYNTACTVAGSDGTLAFGGVGGITLFHPAYIRPNNYSPQPIITLVSVWDANSGKWLRSKPNLKYDQNILTFHFTNNNFSNQRRDQYNYRLIGLESNWHENDNNYSATYNSLRPGSYIFQVKSANSDGVWADQPAEYAFTIVSPWWKSGWFMTMVALLVSGTVFGSMKMRIRNIRQKAGLNNRIVESKMMALRAQMNPHFIFNCLNSIDAFIQSNDKYQATTYLNKFARLLRNVLDSSKQNIVTFSKDLETLKLYIELEELRNDHRFATTFHIDELLLNDDFKVPPLLIQPYVENAIIHGLRNRKGKGGELKIVAVKLEEYIQFIIEDNGVGRNAAQSVKMRNKHSYGMQMSGERIKYFNEEEFPQVEIIDLESDGEAVGTRVEVFLKLK